MKIQPKAPRQFFTVGNWFAIECVGIDLAYLVETNKGNQLAKIYYSIGHLTLLISQIWKKQRQNKNENTCRIWISGRASAFRRKLILLGGLRCRITKGQTAMADARCVDSHYLRCTF